VTDKREEITGFVMSFGDTRLRGRSHELTGSQAVMLGACLQ